MGRASDWVREVTGRAPMRSPKSAGPSSVEGTAVLGPDRHRQGAPSSIRRRQAFEVFQGTTSDGSSVGTSEYRGCSPDRGHRQGLPLHRDALSLEGVTRRANTHRGAGGMGSSAASGNQAVRGARIRTRGWNSSSRCETSKYFAHRLRRPATHRLRHFAPGRRFRDFSERDHRLTGLLRARGLVRGTCHSCMRHLQPRGNVVLCDHRPRAL